MSELKTTRPGCFASSLSAYLCGNADGGGVGLDGCFFKRVMLINSAFIMFS